VIVTPPPLPIVHLEVTVVVPTPSPTHAPGGEAQVLWGDVDCDGEVDAVDAVAILMAVVGLAPEAQGHCPGVGAQVEVDGMPRLWGDVDGDGEVDAVDALHVLR